MNQRSNGLWVTVLTGLALGVAGAAWAQPAAEELAERIDRVHAEQIRDIDEVYITSEVMDGMAKGAVSTTHLQKTEKNGRPVLAPVQGRELDSMQLSGMHDGKLSAMVRKARTIEQTQHDGAPSYLVTVDDVAYLKSLGDFGMDDRTQEFKPKSAQVWIDARELWVHKLIFVQEGPTGGEMQVDVSMSDYRPHRGLPVPHEVQIQVSGMDQMISTAEMEEARRGLEMMKAQLESMPEGQRAMIETMMAPQIEQFEKMMQSGGTTMEVRVTGVSFE